MELQVLYVHITRTFSAFGGKVNAIRILEGWVVGHKAQERKLQLKSQTSDKWHQMSNKYDRLRQNSKAHISSAGVEPSLFQNNPRQNLKQGALYFSPEQENQV